MLFHTPIFLFAFLPITLIFYYLVRSYTKIPHEYVLIIAGLIFYAYWNIYLSPLIIISILSNFYFGKYLRSDRSKNSKKLIIISAVSLNILFLAFFKYSDFIIQNFNHIFDLNLKELNLPFPLAISFFTFQTIAFLVDCKEDNIKDYSLAKYSLFIIFFPQLIAGPIVRYNYMMPQFEDENNKSLNRHNITLGFLIILIGLFKKILIADNLSIFVNNGFTNHADIDLLNSWLSSFSFTFQIYFDFSGYVDMATGIALLFNIRLPKNFDSPFKATSIINFWQRWHITLSNFLMNFIYVPWTRSFKKLTYFKAMFVAVMVFLIAGIWHGPAWTFVIFGILHGFGLIINHGSKRFFKFKINKIILWFITFNYVNLAFIFFRAENFTTAFNIIRGMAGLNGFSNQNIIENNYYSLLAFFISIILCFFFKNINYLLDNFKFNK